MYKRLDVIVLARWLVTMAALFATPIYARPGPTGEPLRGSSLTRYQVRDLSGQQVTYYASRPKQAAPILLMIQGSGCGTVIRETPTGLTSSLFDLATFAAEGQFTVVAVEKPFASGAAQGGTALACGDQFNSWFTAESWLAALQAALRDARKLPWVDASRTLVFGGSEGAVMAGLLASHDRLVTDVVVVSGSGTTQLYDFIAAAYQNCFDRTACIEDATSKLRGVQQDPQSANKFAWGHPNKRWSSFFKVDLGNELQRTKARVYLAMGTADPVVPPLSQEVAVARLLAAGRDVTVRRVSGADHSLMPPGSSDFAALDREYRLALAWFWSHAGL